MSRIVSLKKYYLSFLLNLIPPSPVFEERRILHGMKYVLFLIIFYLLYIINLYVQRDIIFSRQSRSIFLYQPIQTASNSCLDHIFMKSKTHYSMPIISPIIISDHYPIFLSIGNLISNRNSKPNPLTINRIDHSKLSNLITIFNIQELKLVVT